MVLLCLSNKISNALPWKSKTDRHIINLVVKLIPFIKRESSLGKQNYKQRRVSCPIIWDY